MLRSAVAVLLLLVAPVLARANEEETRSCANEPAGCMDLAEQEDGAVEVRTPNYGRALGEVAGAVLGGAAWYWIERDRQVADWDFPSIADRLSLDIFVNDSNPFAINHIWHTVSGASFHLFARSNGLGVVASSLVALAGSLSWEYGVEYREKISVNDIIFTAVAELPAGEFAHWIGRYLQRDEGGFGRTLARWTVGLPQTAHNRLDGLRGYRGPEIAARFHTSTGVGTTSVNDHGDQTTAHLRFKGELAVGDHYLQPGVRSGTFREVNFTSLGAELGRGTDSRVARFGVDALIAGWYRQSIPPDTAGKLGTALHFGVASGIHYRNDAFGAWRDRVGLAHFPGPAIDADLLGSNWRLRGRARLSLDYGGLHALGRDRWRADNPDEIGKTVLDQQGYHYAWGASARLAVELSSPRFGIGATALYGRYTSNDGFDRVQDMLTVDQQIASRVGEYQAFVRTSIYKSLFVEVRSAAVRRHEVFEDLATSARSTRHTIDIGAHFK